MRGPDRLSVSLILTVRDEAESIDALLDSVAAQTWPPDEIIVVDGGSRDDTVSRLEARRATLPLEVIEAPGANISQGRNLALARARGEIVAVTDGGVRLDTGWLEGLVEPFTGPEAIQPDVVAGFFRADPHTLFEVALGATTLPDACEIDGERFQPSSRSVAFRRSWFRAGIRYPEWLDYCEDLIFDFRLRRAGARFTFQPGAFVWFRPRPSAVAYFQQYYRYARGDGKAGLFPRRHAARYATYLGLVPLALFGRDRRVTLLAALGGVLYLRRPWLRLWRRREALGTWRLLATMALVAPLRLIGDVAKMVGYPVGLRWRARRYGLRRTWRDIPEASDSVGLGEAVEERVAQSLRRG